jgi:glycosyltransferase involved in cell wall biosynthesis
VIDACHEMGVPVVYRLSDFQMVCPNYKLFRDGRIREECIHGRYYRGALHRCLKGSLSVSAARVFGMYLDRIRRTRARVAAYVTPSKILRDKMVEGGFDPEKVFHISTFMDVSEMRPSFTPGDYVLYVGQIEPIKGVRLLIEAFSLLKTEKRLPLLIAGYSLWDEEEKLKDKVAKEGLEGR